MWLSQHSHDATVRPAASNGDYQESRRTRHPLSLDERNMTTKWQEFHRQSPPTVEDRAPDGQFRAIACDTFEWLFADYLVGDFLKLDAAIAAAIGALSPMTGVYVYDHTGQLRFNAFEPS
jgi:hypothetical protein